MKRFACVPALLTLLLATAPAPAQSLTLPEKVQLPRGLVVIRATEVDADQTAWFVISGTIQQFPADVIPPKLGVFVGFADDGVYRLGVVAAKVVNGKAALSGVYETELTVGKPKPPPPPGPEPPTPGPSPIAADGLHVLIIEDVAKRSELPAAQSAVLFAKPIRDYLDSKCPAGPDGKTREWRIWDKSTAGEADSKLWGDAMKRPRQSLPWIIVSNPQKGGGFEGPLPADIDSTLALLKKWGD